MPAKGQKRPPHVGRQKGTPNKSTQDLMELAEKVGVSPFEVLLRFAAGDWKGLGYENECYFVEKPDGAVKMGFVISPEMRLKAAGDVCKYLYPQRKAIEVANADEKGFRIIVEDYQSGNKK